MSPRLPWLLIYVFCNVAAATIMYNTGELIGDVAGSTLHSKTSLIIATILVLSSYIIILGPIYNLFSKIKINTIKFNKNENVLGRRIGFLLITLQLLYLLFNVSEGVNIAGSMATKTDNPLAKFWVLVPIDMLFFIYYGIYRENKLFLPNLFVWIISYLLRGWSGVFLFVIFFEWCRAVHKNKITWVRTFFAGVTITVCYPLLIAFKWVLRASATTGIKYNLLFIDFKNVFSDTDYFQFILNGIEQIIGRLQVTSLVVEVMRLKEVLQSEYTNGRITPFWMEGIHGIILDLLFTGKRSTYIGVAITQFLDASWVFDVGNWNTNIGYPGWFFIAPQLIPLFIVYTLVLGFISYYLIKKIDDTTGSKDMLWLAWLVYLLPPWLAVFVNFIYALFVFLIIKTIFSYLPNIKFYSTVNH